MLVWMQHTAFLQLEGFRGFGHQCHPCTVQVTCCDSPAVCHWWDPAVTHAVTTRVTACPVHTWEGFTLGQDQGIAATLALRRGEKVSWAVSVKASYCHSVSSCRVLLPVWMLRWRRHHKWGSSDSEGYPDIYYRLHRLERVKKTSLKQLAQLLAFPPSTAQSWTPVYRHCSSP